MNPFAEDMRSARSQSGTSASRMLAALQHDASRRGGLAKADGARGDRMMLT